MKKIYSFETKVMDLHCMISSNHIHFYFFVETTFAIHTNLLYTYSLILLEDKYNYPERNKEKTHLIIGTLPGKERVMGCVITYFHDNFSAFAAFLI